MPRPPRIIVNCPVCGMSRPIGAFGTQSRDLKIRTLENIHPPGEPHIRNVVEPVEDEFTRRTVYDRVRGALQSALRSLPLL